MSKSSAGRHQGIRTHLHRGDRWRVALSVLGPIAAAAMVLVAPPAAGAVPVQARPAPTAARPRPSALPDSVGERHLCGAVEPGQARCDAIEDTLTNRASMSATATATATATAAAVGLAPGDLQDAYHFPSATAGSGQTVAVVAAHDNPMAEHDLAAYRASFGLPACTTANGCFRKINQAGGSAPATFDQGWAGEISLDLDMVSAICPNCHILLVEATTTSLDDFGTAVNQAAAVGATEISNSYGGAERSTDPGFCATYYDHPGVPVVASSGDSGYGVQIPAACPTVTAVGGTSLVSDGSARGWTETAWDGAGSGCSVFEAKPAWQSDNGCPNRTMTDIAAVADPHTPVLVYDSYQNGWAAVGGTSVAAPIVAAGYALAPTSTSYAQSIYAHTDDLFDVTEGSDGVCSPGYLCAAGPGYDGPTGNGTPDGTGALTMALSPSPGDAAASVAPGGAEVDVFDRTTRQSLEMTRAVGGGRWASAQDLGGALTSGPAAASPGPGQLVVVARGTDGGVWLRSARSGAWSGWTALGGQAVGEPALVSWSPGRLDLFVRGSDDQLWHRWSTAGQWSGWESLGGALTSAPSASSGGPGSLNVFVRGRDNSAYERSWTGTAWTGWWSAGGTLTSKPAAASQPGGRTDLFARGTDGGLWHMYLLAAGGSGWESLGGQLTSAPAADSRAPGSLDAFVLGTDGSIWQRAFQGGWSAWAHVP